MCQWGMIRTLSDFLLWKLQKGGSRSLVILFQHNLLIMNSISADLLAFHLIRMERISSIHRKNYPLDDSENSSKNLDLGNVHLRPRDVHLQVRLQKIFYRTEPIVRHLMFRIEVTVWFLTKSLALVRCKHHTFVLESEPV